MKLKLNMKTDKTPMSTEKINTIDESLNLLITGEFNCMIIFST